MDRSTSGAFRGLSRCASVVDVHGIANRRHRQEAGFGTESGRQGSRAGARLLATLRLTSWSIPLGTAVACGRSSQTPKRTVGMPGVLARCGEAIASADPRSYTTVFASAGREGKISNTTSRSRIARRAARDYRSGWGECKESGKTKLTVSRRFTKKKYLEVQRAP